MANIALYPGGYKPPHIGHYEAAKEALEQADKVIVFVGPKEREDITQDMSIQLWELYTQKDNIEIKKAGVSPVRDVYDFVELEAKDGDTLYFIKGEKDSEDPRFAKIPTYAEKFNKKINIDFIDVEDKMDRMGYPISGTWMRNYIKKNKFQDFKLGLPKHLSTEQENEAWAIVTGDTNYSSPKGGTQSSQFQEDLYNPEDKVNDYMRSSEFKAGYTKKDDVPPGYKYRRGGQYNAASGQGGAGTMYEIDKKIIQLYEMGATMNKQETAEHNKKLKRWKKDLEKYNKQNQYHKAPSYLKGTHSIKLYENSTISTALIDNIPISLETMNTPDQQMTGMMGRDSLEGGMLFPYNQVQRRDFHMKNCKISLDIIFIKQGKIDSIHNNCPPCKQNSCPNYSGMADNVIEFPGGYCDKNNINIGDEVNLTIDNTPAQPPIEINEKKKGLDGKACWKGYKLQGTKMKGGKRVDNCVKTEVSSWDGSASKQPGMWDSKPSEKNTGQPFPTVGEDKLSEKKGKCKPSKGKRFAKRVNGKCRSYGQAGKAKKGGDRIRPGTKKGHAYCARSAKIKKCKNPPCANKLSRKKWKCQGSRSVAEASVFSKDWWSNIINEILLTEGGAAGHMAHPFNLSNVNSGKDLKNIFEKSANSLQSNPGSVKIDGVNSSIRLVDLDGKKQFVMDRGSKKPLDIKGITKDDLEDRFKPGHGMVKVGGEVLDMFNEALPSLENDLKKLGAWDDPNILFNMEYVSGKTNVQDYGSNFIAIHGLNRIESKEVQGKRQMLTKRSSTEVSYDKSALQSMLDNLSPIAKQNDFEVYGSVPTELKGKPNFSAALSKSYTIKSNEGDKTQSLDKWLNELNDIPEKDFIFMNVNSTKKKVGAVSKQVYVSILQGENIDDLFEEEDKQKAIEGFTTYLATEKLGDEVLKVLDSPMGSVEDHEGVVIRDEKISNEPFKITGKFILGGMVSDF